MSIGYKQEIVGSVLGQGKYSEVANYSSLPAAADHTGEIYAVLAAEGVWLLSRKRAGFYYSDGISWTRLGDIKQAFNDANFTIFNNTDSSKQVKTDASGITIASVRTVTFDDADMDLSHVNLVAGNPHNVSYTDTGAAGINGAPNTNEIAIWHDSDEIKGDSNLTWDGSILTVLGQTISFPSGTRNLLIGNNAGSSITTGDDNIYIGKDTGKSSTVTSANTAIGCYALENATGGDNVAIGHRTGQGIIAGRFNTLVGRSIAKTSNMEGCTIIGYKAGEDNTGDNVTYVGRHAGQHLTGNKNIAIGYEALEGSSGSSTGSSNIAIGVEGLKSLTTSSNSVGVGWECLLQLTSGDSNTFVGAQAGRNLTTQERSVGIGQRAGYRTGSYSVSLGYYAGYTTNNGRNVFIGYRAGYSTNNTENVIIGYQAGYNSAQHGCVLIGKEAGYNNGSNDRLYIENSNSATPLIYGEFDNDVLKFYGRYSSPKQSVTLGAGDTTFAVTRNFVEVTGDGGGNTIATITGGIEGMKLTLLFVDGNVQITDDNTHAANSVDLSAAFTSADDTVLELVYDGTSWYEVSRSVN